MASGKNFQPIFKALTFPVVGANQKLLSNQKSSKGSDVFNSRLQ